MTSLGTGFDLLLVRGALCALGLAALWGVVVLGTTAAEALSSGRIQLASRIGCPSAFRVWLVGAFAALFAGIAPAHAGDTGSGAGTPGATLAAALDGLPLPDRVVGTPSRPSTTYVVRPGDSLWSVARRTLPPGASDADLAAEVQRLYLANRSVIGPDPDLLRPGQRLRTAPISH
ncbi:MAG TPA: LysM domain-containing protein [Marmoricola sp.]|nr:LysM domain-containing protein [Marmoricola sp.]